MSAIQPVSSDPQREIPGIEPGHPAMIVLTDGEQLVACQSHLKGRAWQEGDLILAWPVDEHGEFVPLRMGQTALVEVWPAHDALYTVDALVKSARPEVREHVVLAINGVWQRVQRREDVRFPARIAPTSALAVTGELRMLNASIRDLSAGGLRVWSGQEIVLGDELRITFSLPDSGPEITARVAVERIEPFEYQNVTLWEGGCIFVDLPQATRDRIVRYIFNEQRALAQQRRS
jgi:c-di-GMP-binding flagellar brake protein YcgR